MYEDSNTVKTCCKRKREDTEERNHVKKIKLRSNQEDKPEDPSSNEKWPGVNRVVVRLTNSSDSSCSSDDGRCSLGTVEDFSRDRQKSLCFIVSNSSSKPELEIERHRLSLSEEDEENSSTLLNADTERQRFSTPREGTSDGSVTALTSNDRTNRIVFEATYKQEERIGQGAYGSVFAGYRECDKLPVTIKHIPVERIQYTTVSQHGKEARVPLEVALLLRLRDVPAVVTLLDWYGLGSEVVLVLERPEHCADLFDYVNSKRDLEEHSVKIIMQQLVDAFIEIHSRGVLHKDVHFKNILIEFGSTVPRIRIIDFGQGSFLKSDENRDTSTVLQLGHMVYNLLRLASMFTSSDITEATSMWTFFRSERTRHSISYLQYLQCYSTSRENIGKKIQHDKYNQTLGKIHMEEHVEFKERSAEKEKEKQTPKRMLKQTSLDNARPYRRDSYTNYYKYKLSIFVSGYIFDYPD
ncbi:uncharacterized protein V6R79_023350 [Siganus canaliculatus]